MLLQDTQVGEPKTLIEEKLKKVTTERAPVAGQTVGGAGGGPGGRYGRGPVNLDVGDEGLQEALRSVMREGSGGGAALNELLRQSAQGRGLDLARDIFGDSAAAGSGSGAAAAAGVLTAIDEDEEGAEEAQAPGEFEYFTENEDEEEEEL